MEHIKLDWKMKSLANAETCTAWGCIQPLDATLARIVANSTSKTIELSIGALPVSNPASLIAHYRGEYGLDFTAHHNTPIFPNKSLRPSINVNPEEMAEQLANLGISRYSAHPPAKKFVSEQGFFEWANNWYEVLQTYGISFCVENMYETRLRDNSKVETFFLSTINEIHRFVEQMKHWDNKPLLLDLSHLYISSQTGILSENDILDLLDSELYDEAHYSMNDGRRDVHRSINESDHLMIKWINRINPSCSIIVDEGKKPLKGNYND